MSDYLIRATAASGQVRAFCITSRDLVEEARSRHNTSPVATAALGRLLSAGAMMGTMQKSDVDRLTLRVIGDGPIGGITVVADNGANVRGYVDNPEVLLPAKNGKLDVGGAVGAGILQVTRDMDMKEPYSSQVELVTGEIAEDLTYYFASSEQVPSSVGLGVLMEKNNTVKQAGGFIIQMMPYATEDTISRIEDNLKSVRSVTELLDQGLSPEGILDKLLGNTHLTITDKIPARFYCGCNRERVSKALASIGKDEIQDMIDEGKDIDVRCHYCNEIYTYSVNDLKQILEGMS